VTLSPRLRRSAALALATIVGTAAAFSPVGRDADRLLDVLRYAVLDKPASGRVVIVEMDAASAAAIKRWPWPRDHYAGVVDRLRRAGAASVVFDVDLSAEGTPDGDRALAAALARADGMVALPTFGQAAGAGERRSLDTLPLPMFRDHAALASVSIDPDEDGSIRQAPFGTMTEDTPRPSLSAYMAHRSGTADEAFPIDFSIDPATIPRLSFVAVRDGRFDPAAVRGKDVLLGGTAVEMADRYPVPRWGVIPGVVVQALAAETLLNGIPVSASSVAGLLAALVVAAATLHIRSGRRAMLATGLGCAIIAAAAIVIQARWGRIYPVSPALALILTATIARIAGALAERFNRQRLTDEPSGMPNRLALAAELRSRNTTLAVAQLVNHDALMAILGAAHERDVMRRLGDRLAIGVGGGAVYRVADRLLAVEVQCEDMAEAMAGLRALMLQPLEVAGRRVDLTVAIGVVAGAGEACEVLLADASMAAEAAYRDGRFWARAAADLDLLEREVSLMGELDSAIASGEGVMVHYQPKLRLSDDRIGSVEALVRWQHPTRGFIGPDLFVPLAEQSDRIAPLTLYVIERVMHDLAHWLVLGHDLTAAVNISAKLLTADPFNAALSELLTRAIVPASRLVFEVTESAAIADPAGASAALSRYRDMGVAISMDDYGTGQSTLSYLRQLPLSELKIDRSFVQNAHQNRNDGVLVRSTVELAHALGLKVVAEGIETEGCLEFLRGIGCDMAQGYLISRPVEADALLDILTLSGEQRSRPFQAV
jgi:EAL domain-containing protein (putative c-di-GMP-specific phosphodiesterase class I)/CHASE2 domain-containing sensor protein